MRDEDLRELQNRLTLNPKLGSVIQGTGGARKLRFEKEPFGKSSSIRVIYVDLEVKEQIYLIFAYGKGVQEDLNDEEKKEIHALITRLKG